MIFTNLFVLLNLLLLTTQTLLPTETNNEIPDKLIEIFTNLKIKKYQQSTTEIIIRNHNENVNTFLKELYKIDGSKVIIYDIENQTTCSTTEAPYLGHVNLAIIFLKNESISCISGIVFKRKRTRSILVFDENSSPDFISRIFVSLWEEKILNVAILTYIDGELKILGYNPYFKEWYQVLDGGDAFYDKLRDLNRYRLNLMLTRREDFTKVRVYREGNETRYMGKDGMTILSVIGHCNGDYSVVDLHAIYWWYGNPFRPMNKFWVAEKEKAVVIKKHDADIFMEPMETALNDYTDVVYPHAKDDYKVILPAGRFLTQDENLLKLMQQGFLHLILFFVMICPLVWFLLIVLERYLKNNTPHRFQLFLTITFNNFRMFLGSSTNNFTLNFVENLFFLVLLFSNLVVNSYFQSILSSILTVSVREPEINTIQELAASKKRVHSIQSLINETILNFQQTNRSIPNFEVLPLKMNTMLYRDFPKNTSFLINEDRLLAFKELRPSFHIVKESLIPAYTAFHVPKGSPYFTLLEKYVPRILEAGLYNFWKKQNSYAVFLEYGYLDEVESQVAFTSLNMQHFWGALSIYFFGLGLSFVVFLLELLVNYFKR